MAITRAQIARELYKDGKRVGLKGGADAATASFGASVGYSDPKTGSTGRPDRDFNPGTGGGGPTFGDAKATTVTGDDVKKAKKKYEQQFYDKGKVPPLGSRPTNFRTKLNQRNKQKRLDYINRLIEARRNKISKGLFDIENMPGVDLEETEDYFGFAPSVKDLVEQGFYKSDGQFAKGEKIPDFPSTDLPGTLGIVQDIFAGPVTSDKLEQLNQQIKDLEGLKTTKGLEGTTFNQLMETYEPNRFKLENPEPGGRDDTPEDPCLGPNPPAYCFVNQDPTDPETPKRNLGGLAPRFGGSIFNFDNLADGGRAGMMDGGMMDDDPTGGIMDLETGRQMYFLGKLVKKAKRAVKKVVKSPFGKAALFAAPFLMNPAAKAGIGSFFGKGSFNPLRMAAAATSDDFLGPSTELSPLGKILSKFGMATGEDGGKLTLGGKIGLGFGLPFVLDALGVGKKDDDKMDLDDYYKRNSINIADIRMNPYNYLAPRFAADGGLMRTGYQEGGDAEPVAKKTMPLLDMDGKEKDYRETGGFVDMGRMERADDVPARLSKNEFVFTADAVRNAGEGDIDKGAEVMYNMMKNLEAGGEVSEESQGLEGARNMFQTSQRLGEVI